MRYISDINRCVAAVIAVISFISCSLSDKEDFEIMSPWSENSRMEGTRVPNSESRHVFIMYSIGFNNLSHYLKEDISDLENSPLPGHFRSDDVILVFAHNTDGQYTNTTSPVLIRLNEGPDGKTVRDTVKVFEKGTVSASAQTLNQVLTYIKEEYPAESYGMLMSSHATGWVPAGYTSDPSGYEGNMDLQRSFGSQRIPVTSVDQPSAYEIDIDDLAQAIPITLDYIIFDACFMGGVEVAYELRNVCRRICASQTEILADGMNYHTLVSYLTGEDTPDLTGFCLSYYEYYNSRTRENRSATISCIDCTRMEPLAEICREIFQANREAIHSLNRASVQQYFRSVFQSQHGWFYDLEDIAAQCGATPDQLERLHQALDECICFKAATERFMESFTIRTHCGLSMYLPHADRLFLNSFYRSLAWNEATGLVE